MLNAAVRVYVTCDNADHFSQTRHADYEEVHGNNKSKCVNELRVNGWRIKGSKTICPQCAQLKPNTLKIRKW